MRGCKRSLAISWKKLEALYRKGEVVESATSHLQYKVLIAHKQDPLRILMKNSAANLEETPINTQV